MHDADRRAAPVAHAAEEGHVAAAHVARDIHLVVGVQRKARHAVDVAGREARVVDGVLVAEADPGVGLTLGRGRVIAQLDHVAEVPVRALGVLGAVAAADAAPPRAAAAACILYTYPSPRDKA